MVTTVKRTNEKGQRTARSTDAYLPKGGLAEPALCKKCGALYKEKRWTLGEAEQDTATTGTKKIVCPACQRMADNNPAGIISLSGAYLVQHEHDILNIIKNTEARARNKNPLGRIMGINQEGTTITITTTEEKLAQKLGREIFKACRGELHFCWNTEENLVRVNWHRD